MFGKALNTPLDKNKDHVKYWDIIELSSLTSKSA